MSEISSYPEVYTLGHRAVRDILTGPVVVEEKVDGSQFSFGRYSDGLACRSKGQQIDLDNPGMFAKAVEAVDRIGPHLELDWTYRGEYLAKPKHNVLAYSRVPDRYIVLYDVMTGIETYLDPYERAREAARLEMESVPVLWQGKIHSVQQLEEMLTTTSFLGGQIIEGIVIKNYDLFDPMKKRMTAKLVRESFKEVHRKEWNHRKVQEGIVELLAKQYGTEARWQKAVQHLREDGLLQEAPQDIPKLLKEVNQDVLREEKEAIQEDLWKHFWPQVSRGITRGLAEWYKEQLSQEIICASE